MFCKYTQQTRVYEQMQNSALLLVVDPPIIPWYALLSGRVETNVVKDTGSKNKAHRDKYAICNDNATKANKAYTIADSQKTCSFCTRI